MAAAAKTVFAVVVMVLAMAEVAKGEQKMRVYLHGNMYYRNASFNTESVAVGRSASMSTPVTSFGEVHVIDDPLTSGPTMASSKVGRGQGVYAYCGRTMISAWWSFTAFLDGRGTLTMVGVEQIGTSVPRVLSVVGGTGEFAHARGSVLIGTTAAKPPNYFVVSLDFTLLLPS